MPEVTNELLYEILKKVQDQLVQLNDGQRAIREELTSLRAHQLAMQRDIYNIHERMDSVERRLDRIERRLEMSDAHP